MRPNWDEYFMTMAIVASTRSTCHNVRAGCVIVLDKRIIGTGYNGAPSGMKNCFELGDCKKKILGLEYKNSLNSGTCIGVHAEMNALANLSRLTHKGGIVYATIFPCVSCAKNLLAYNISRVVYKNEYDSKEFETSKKMLKEAGVIVEKLDIKPERVIEILFNNKASHFNVFSEEDKKRILRNSD
jgi:dCMP deaminase